MKKTFHVRERFHCRLCEGQTRAQFQFADTPMANCYTDAPDMSLLRHPMILVECANCGHVQQGYVSDGLFEDYRYETPRSGIPHLFETAKLLKIRFPNARKVLEIGCNNGLFLDCLCAVGFDAVGIDPANTHMKGVTGYFSSKTAPDLPGPFDIVVANNVFAHIDDLIDVFLGIDTILAPDGAVVFEVQYFRDLAVNGTFDMCYMEHMSYHTLTPLVGFLRRFGLVLSNWEHLYTQGGSIRVFAERKGCPCKIEEPVLDWKKFSNRVADSKEYVRSKVSGRKLALLGAAAKATTLLYHCDIVDCFDFACDDSVLKQGRYLPGTEIQIRPTSELGQQTALLSAWNYDVEWRRRFPANELIHPFPLVSRIG